MTTTMRTGHGLTAPLFTAPLFTTLILTALPCAALPYAALPLAAQTTVALPAADRPLDLRLGPLWAAGEIDGQPWEEFESLGGAAFGPDGRLYLMDRGRVLAVGPDGRLLHMVGTSGDGPGEYRSPHGLVVLAAGSVGGRGGAGGGPSGGVSGGLGGAGGGDREGGASGGPSGAIVAVFDFGKRAFLLYDERGEHLDEVRPGLEVGVPGEVMAATAEGSVLALAARILTGRLGHAFFAGTGVRPAEGSLPLLRVPLATGAAAEVVTRVRVPEPEGAPPHPMRRGFEPLPSWGPLAGGRVALLHASEYRIEIVGPDGRIERVLERPLEARPTTESDREAYRRQQAARPTRTFGARGGEGRPPEPSDFWFAPILPPVMAITADGGDRIWVLRRDPDDPTRPGPVDVLSAEGRYLGTIPRETLEATGSDGLPAAFGPDGRVVFLGRGELDVPVARAYRVRWPEGGARRP